MQNNRLVRFVFVYLLFASAVGSGLLLFLQSRNHAGAAYVVPSSMYFFLLNALFHIGLMRASARRPAVFVRYYMAATTLKLFLHLGIVVFVALSDRQALFPFAIIFLPLYLFHTGFEAVFAFKEIRHSA